MINRKISVVTVVYNAVHTIEQTILSVINQSYVEVEYVIIDGGSTDGTLGIIEKYSDDIDLWLSERDAGIYDAMNKGAALTTGGWVLFLGADDILLNVLHKLAPLMMDDHTFYYGNAYMLDSGIVYAGKFTKWKLAYKNICHQALLYPRVIFESYSYDLAYRIHADYNFNLLAFADKRYSFQYINRIVCTYGELGFSTKNSDTFYTLRRFEILRARYPLYIYYYAKMRMWAAKRLKKKYIDNSEEK